MQKYIGKYMAPGWRPMSMALIYTPEKQRKGDQNQKKDQTSRSVKTLFFKNIKE